MEVSRNGGAKKTIHFGYPIYGYIYIHVHIYIYNMYCILYINNSLSEFRRESDQAENLNQDIDLVGASSGQQKGQRTTSEIFMA